MAIDSRRLTEAPQDGMPVFLAAGTEVDGEFSCTTCGYGISVRRSLPRCPMCGSEMWEPMGFGPLI
jgi:rubrerythrin